MYSWSLVPFEAGPVIVNDGSLVFRKAHYVFPWWEICRCSIECKLFGSGYLMQLIRVKIPYTGSWVSHHVYTRTGRSACHSRYALFCIAHLKGIF